jgi:hypothetical protein
MTGGGWIAYPGTGAGCRSGQLPDALRIGLRGPPQLDGATRSAAHAGGRQLGVLPILLAWMPGVSCHPARSPEPRGDQNAHSRLSVASPR